MWMKLREINTTVISIQSKNYQMKSEYIKPKGAFTEIKWLTSNCQGWKFRQLWQNILLFMNWLSKLILQLLAMNQFLRSKC